MAPHLPARMKDKTAVVLFNLGGPDTLEAVQPFLFNLFSDPDIFKLPLGLITQKPFAYIIARRRKGEASRGYAAIGGKSPLLENTQRQADALTQALATVGNYDVHTCMRYWHPLTDKVVKDLKHAEYKNVILLPLYPQYSLTTTGSSYNEFVRQCQRQDYHPQVVLIEHWYDNETYLDAIIDDIHEAQHALPDSDPAQIELLFSAHGLPQKFIDAGDPYERQIRATYNALCARLNWPRTSLCYQSRVGPLRWLSPYTEDMIRQLGQAGAQQVLVYPIAFVSDHTETLYELGIQYAALAKANGIKHYRVIPALNDHPKLIQALVEQVQWATIDEAKFHSI
ncbi:MAG TPA: ferrochelatase [Acidiferrobacteraceae bacterium]|nr:ferrochelatase [Acidiferrobacteraceae bacterium]